MKGPDPIIRLHGLRLIKRIKEISRDPKRAQALIGGTLTSIIAGWDDDEWEQIMAASQMPCGIPDCDCEIWGEKFFVGLNAGREHHKLVMAKR